MKKFHAPGVALQGRKQVLETFDLAAARKAIYIDYEGRPFHPPALLGWKHAGRHRTTILDPQFASASRRWRARHVTVNDHATVARKLLNLADQGHHIVSWSQHDLYVMAKVLTDAQVESLLSRYVNALAVIRPWYRDAHGGKVPGGASLSHLRKHFDFKIPAKYADGVVGNTLASLEQRFADGVEYGQLSKDERASWVAVVKHNGLDLIHMRRIVLQVLGQAPELTDG